MTGEFRFYPDDVEEVEDRDELWGPDDVLLYELPHCMNCDIPVPPDELVGHIQYHGSLDNPHWTYRDSAGNTGEIVSTHRPPNSN